jgi:hypothetical protein
MDVKACASVALQLISKTQIAANDESLDAVIATRNMLRCLASGEFVIVTAAPAQASTPPPPGAEV